MLLDKTLTSKLSTWTSALFESKNGWEHTEKNGILKLKNVYSVMKVHKGFYGAFCLNSGKTADADQSLV